ncbi:MAG TPA: hypothetical protein VF552_06580 [Allosphingosinicella sp.]|jgi:hypothetical protein
MWLNWRSQPGVVLAIMTYGVENIAKAARIAAAGFALLLAAAPTDAAASSTAGQSRASLSVSAIVAPSCRIETQSPARHAVACSAGTAFSAATVAHRDETPLSDAAAILGAPARGSRGIEFAAPVRPAAALAAEGGHDTATRYLTITY